MRRPVLIPDTEVLMNTEKASPQCRSPRLTGGRAQLPLGGQAASMRSRGLLLNRKPGKNLTQPELRQATCHASRGIRR